MGVPAMSLACAMCSTDDQDQLLGGSFPISPFNKGVTPMPNVQKLMVEEGAMATNFFMCAATATARMWH